MGQAKNRQALRHQFFARNPRCIFCGGHETATTEDHQPPRSLFRERHWPEGYVFPACNDCNRATKDDENILGAVLRMTLAEHDEIDQREFRSHLQAVRNNYPGVLESMDMSATEKRSAVRKFGLRLADGQTFSNLPMVKLADAVKGSIDRVFFKLGCALHYRYVGKLIPPEGVVISEFRTNVAQVVQPVPESMLRLTPQIATPTRNKRLLNDQFTYRYNFSVEIEAAVFNCVIRDSFHITLLTLGKPEIAVDRKDNSREFLVDGFLKRTG